MKTCRKWAIGILGGYAAGLALAGFAATHEIPFTATAVTSWVNFGTAIEDGTHLLILNARVSAMLTASDARVGGAGTVVCSGIWQTNKLGLSWGSFHITNAGGAWDGYWQGTNSFENGQAITSVLLTAEGSARYQGLVFRSTGRSVDRGPFACTGSIILNSHGARPFYLKGLRVDRAMNINGTVLDPLTLRPTGNSAALAWIVIGSQGSEASCLGRITEEGLGLLDPVTGVCSMMGAAIPADSGQGDVLRWVAQATTDLRKRVATNLKTAVVTAEVHFAGGTGRFEDATGGFNGKVTELVSPIPGPSGFQNSFQYEAAGTIRFSEPAEGGD